MNYMTSSVTKAVGSNVIRNAVDDVRNKFPGSQSNSSIKWDNFNYPPLLKIIHYDLKELDAETGSLVRKLNFVFMLNFLVSIINFINSLAQIPVNDSGIRILYSVLNMLIFIPFTLYGFYKGYRGLTHSERELKFYYVISLLEIIAFFVFSIISGGCYNGWTRVATLFKNNYIFQGILGIIESVIYLGMCFLIAWNTWKVKNFVPSSPSDNRL